jgi:hypothetical protein
MTKKIIYFVPVFLVIISIITSLVAFAYSKKLENGYIYVNNNPSYVTYEGEYFAIVGNLGDESSFISVDSLNQQLLITIYDSNEIITREYTLEVKIENTTYSSDIVTDYIGTDLLNIDDIEDYIFTMDLEEGETYETILTKTSNNVDEEEIDLVLVILPEHLINMKDLNEGISFSTLVFAGLSGFTILMFIFVKKDN